MSSVPDLPPPPAPGGSEDYNPFADPASPFYRESGDFRPTRRNPVPAMRCSKPKRNGEPCPNWAVAGSGYGGTIAVCFQHGGKLPNVRARADAVLDAARLVLLDSAPDAINVVYGLAMDAETPAQVRLNAAKDILDRAGVKGGADVTVDVNITEKPSVKMFEKLKELRSPTDEEEVLEEVVDEPEDEG